MKGFYIGKSNTFLEKVSKESNELSLLARGDGTEVMLHKVNAGKTIVMCPGDNTDLMEFCFIISGSISYDEEGTKFILNPGDYFYFHDLVDSVYLKAITDTNVLYVSTQPMFHFLSDEINELNNLLNMVEQKDVYTHDHNVRLQEYCVCIGEKLKLSKEQLEALFYASLFHDIGKINTPDEILNKPTSLTKEEFDCIKKHSSDGKKLAENVYIKNVGEIIEQHHERLDGSGYPKGLKGDETLLEAKIIAVVDSFDAMTTDRPYRKGMAPQAALQELKDLSGKLYDKNIVLIFEEVLKNKGVL